MFALESFELELLHARELHLLADMRRLQLESAELVTHAEVEEVPRHDLLAELLLRDAELLQTAEALSRLLHLLLLRLILLRLLPSTADLLLTRAAEDAIDHVTEEREGQINSATAHNKRMSNGIETTRSERACKRV